jgi:phage terminase small subunit
LTRPDIEQAIQRARDEAAKAAELNAEWVLTRLKKVAERCLQEEAVLDREGNPTGEFRFDASGAAKALELIGKTHAMFVDRLKVSEESELPDDELDARIGALTQPGREAPASTATH